MKLKRVGWMLVFALLAGLVFFVSRSEALPETVRIVVPGVWFREGDFKELGHCNNVIIEMKDYLVVVDANFPSGARAVMADLRRISPKPVKYVFLTHHHGDHYYGSSLWTAAGATTLAFKGVSDDLARYEPKRWQSMLPRRKDMAELKRSAPEPPRQTINENIYVLNDGKRKIEFRHFGWGHSRGDGFVYLPKEQVLCTGDAVLNAPANYLRDASIGNWPNVIRAAMRLKVKYVLPGHGEMGGPEIMAGQEQFLVELRKAAQAAVDQGKPVEAVAETLTFSEAARPWVNAGVKAKLKDAYDEIKQGKPRGDLP